MTNVYVYNATKNGSIAFSNPKKLWDHVLKNNPQFTTFDGNSTPVKKLDANLFLKAIRSSIQVVITDGATEIVMRKLPVY